MGMDAGNMGGDATNTPTATPGQPQQPNKLKKGLFGGLAGLGGAMGQQGQQQQGQATQIGIPQPQFQDMTAGYAPNKNKFFGGY